MEQVGQQNGYQWWNEEGPTAARMIFSLINHWDTELSVNGQANLRHFRLYSGRDLTSLSISKYLEAQATGSAMATMPGFSNGINLNVVQSAIDTLTAKITKQAIKPTFMTQGGILEQRNRAQKMNKFLYGAFRESGVNKEAPRAFKNACIFGNGYLYPYYDDFKKKICCEAIFPDEIVVDPASSYYAEPREMYRRKFVSKTWLKEQFPERAAEIDSVKDIVMMSSAINMRDTVMAVEVWRLSGPGVTGRHMICLDGVDLVDDAYKRSRFPLATMRYQQLPIGYWGIGVAEILKGLQIEINYTINRIREQMHKMAKPFIFREKGSQIDPDQMDNEVGTMVDYVGTPPIIQFAQTVSPEQFRHLQDLYNKAFEIIGVTQLSAQGSKPSGLDAAVALREYHDIETERFAETAKAFEQLHVDTAYIMTDILDELGGDYTVSSYSRDQGLERITWADIRLPTEDEYMIHVYPQSALPQQPEARMQRVFELLNAGMIEPQMALDLLDFPDLDSWAKVQLAPVRIIFAILERMIFDKSAEYEMPEPYFDLTLGVKYGMAFYNWAKLNKIPDDRLDMIRQWIDDCNSMIKQAEANAQPPPTPSAPAEIAQQQQLAVGPDGMPAEIGPQMV